MKRLEIQLYCQKDADLFDKVFNSFHQHEVSFAHACIQALDGYINSEDGCHKEQLTELILEFDNKNPSTVSEEIITREIVLDEKTYQQLDGLVDQFNTSTEGDHMSHPEALLYGMAMVSFMQEILARDPKATLAIDARRIPFSHMIALQPQLLN